jgi:glycolate oxidase FAD binding subunit
VAGYDVSRVGVGALGTLGLILEASVKVRPRPALERTVMFELDEAAALARLTALGGEPLSDSAGFWHSVREQTHPFFSGEGPLWRLSLPPAAPALDLGPSFLEWGGAQRWLRGEQDAEALRARVGELGGHATLFRGHSPAQAVFHPLPTALLRLHQELKRAIDPAAIFNPGRLYPEL